MKGEKVCVLSTDEGFFFFFLNTFHLGWLITDAEPKDLEEQFHIHSQSCVPDLFVFNLPKPSLHASENLSSPLATNQKSSSLIMSSTIILALQRSITTKCLSNSAALSQSFPNGLSD